MKNIILMLLTLFPFIAQAEETDAQMQQLVSDHTQFAFSLYPVLEASDSNMVFSPYSISTCLSMVYLGARELTAQEMASALKLNFSPKEIAAPSALLNAALLPQANNDKNYELVLANALWLNDKSYILSDYRYAIEKQFNAKITNISFAKPSSALATINKWVADITRDRIQNLLTQNDISANTRLVLTNAAYFKGAFVRPFDAEQTTETPFYTFSHAQENVQMMEQTSALLYNENDLFQTLALPFKGISKAKGQLALVVLLPKSAQNFDTMIKEVPASFDDALSGLQNAKVHVKLPKFALTKRYSLNAALQQMGMRNPFTTQANFSGIDGMLDLYLNAVVHETYFSLDEKGVTAAAATAASMNLTAAPSVNPPAEFIADHPFMFFIVDLKCKEVLFIGKFLDPTDAI